MPTAGQIAPRDFLSHTLNIHGVPPLRGSLLSQHTLQYSHRSRREITMEERINIKFCFKLGKSAIEIYLMMKKGVKMEKFRIDHTKKSAFTKK